MRPATSVRVFKWVALLALAASSSGCTVLNGWLPGSGPLRDEITNPKVADRFNEQTSEPVRILDVNLETVTALTQALKRSEFSSAFPAVASRANVVGPGDVLEVNIWEATPATLFGTSSGASVSVVNSTASKATTLPDQMVSMDGTISIPFAGAIKVGGSTPEEIARRVVLALQGKANYPQVLVRVSRNATSVATIVGEVNNTQLIPLSAKGERLLDAIAASGGVKQPVNKISIQLARDGKSHSMPLEALIRDPKQNIPLAPNDVITAYFQPLSFTALGATGQNQEVTFESQGISLVQALARVGGLQDNRADAKGVFIFRFEEPGVVGVAPSVGPTQGVSRVPVVYRADLTRGATFLLAQSFPIKDKDVLYVSNASSVELQKFLGILVASVYPIVNIGNVLGR